MNRKTAGSLRISERSAGHTTILDLQGDLLGAESISRLSPIVRRIAQSGRQQLLLNLEGVESIDAGGLGALVDAYRTVARHRGTFALAAAPRRVRDLLVITRLATVFRLFESEEEAVAHEPSIPLSLVPPVWATPHSSPAFLAPIQRFLRHA
jgi:anti-sigma B factor antagonist